MPDQSITSVFNQDQTELHNLRENPEKLSSKKRILYEIEKLLQMQEKDLELEDLNGTSGRTIVSNRTLYKIYKAILQDKNVRPSMVYTGQSVLEFDEAKNLMENTDKDLKDLEVTI